MGKSSGSRPKRPTALEQTRMEPAIYDKHWGMRPNSAGLKSAGNGYACLIANTPQCVVFTKRITLVNHILDYHHLIAGNPPRGRPVTSDRIRKPPSETALQKQKDSFLGNFPLRMWALKKKQMLRTLKWALNSYADATTDEDKWTWVVHNAETVYKKWRQSKAFIDTLKTTIATVVEYWDDANRERHLRFSKYAILKKAALPNSSDIHDDYHSDDGMPIVNQFTSDLKEHCFRFYKRKLKGAQEEAEDGTEVDDVIEADDEQEAGESMPDMFTTESAADKEVHDSVSAASQAEEGGESMPDMFTTESAADKEVHDSVSAALQAEEGGESMPDMFTTESAADKEVHDSVSAALQAEEGGESMPDMFTTESAADKEVHDSVSAALQAEEGGESMPDMFTTESAADKEVHDSVSAALQAEEGGESRPDMFTTESAADKEVHDSVSAALQAEEGGESMPDMFTTESAADKEVHDSVSAALQAEEGGESRPDMFTTESAADKEVHDSVSAALQAEEGGESMPDMFTTESAADKEVHDSVSAALQAEEGGESRPDMFTTESAADKEVHDSVSAALQAEEGGESMPDMFTTESAADKEVHDSVSAALQAEEGGESLPDKSTMELEADNVQQEPMEEAVGDIVSEQLGPLPPLYDLLGILSMIEKEFDKDEIESHLHHLCINPVHGWEYPSSWQALKRIVPWWPTGKTEQQDRWMWDFVSQSSADPEAFIYLLTKEGLDDEQINLECQVQCLRMIEMTYYWFLEPGPQSKMRITMTPDGTPIHLNDVEPSPKWKLKPNFQHLEQELWQVVLKDVIRGCVTEKMPVAIPVLPLSMTRKEGRRGLLTTKTYPFPATYEVVSGGGDSEWLPIDGPRLTRLKAQNRFADVWLWVFGCRKKKPTLLMDTPYLGLRWPENIWLWVGPDGYPIKTYCYPELMKWRQDLWERQALRDKQHSNRMKKVIELGVLGLKAPKFPQILVDMPAI